MALIMALVIWLITIASVVILRHGATHMPGTISEAARSIDGQFFLTLGVTGVAFVLAQVVLGIFVWKFKGDRPGASRYVHGNNAVEVGGALLCAVVFLSLGVLGQRVWAGLHLSDPPAERMVVDILGEQFAWNVRYSGADGKFGQTSPNNYDAVQNPVGIDSGDAAGMDDVTALNNLYVPVDTPVELSLRSKDVLHSFFMPELRIKQDTVPGMVVTLRFEADTVGDYEVACAELCGLGHYRMKGYLHVLPKNEFDTWLAQEATQTGR